MKILCELEIDDGDFDALPPDGVDILILVNPTCEGYGYAGDAYVEAVYNGTIVTPQGGETGG